MKEHPPTLNNAGRIFFIIGMYFFSSTTYAGVGSSGGGYAVVCRTPSGEIQQATLLDLYEVQSKPGVTLIPSSGDLYQDYARVVAISRSLGIDGRPLENEVQSSFEDIKKD